MADYSGEKELLGTGVAAEPMRRTAGALPPGTPAAKQAAKEYAEAAEIRETAKSEIDPSNLPPAIGAPPVPAATDEGGFAAAPSGLGMGEDRPDGMPTESHVPPNLKAAEAEGDKPAEPAPVSEPVPAAEPAPAPAPEPQPAEADAEAEEPKPSSRRRS